MPIFDPRCMRAVIWAYSCLPGCSLRARKTYSSRMWQSAYWGVIECGSAGTALGYVAIGQGSADVLRNRMGARAETDDWWSEDTWLVGHVTPKLAARRGIKEQCAMRSQRSRQSYRRRQTCRGKSTPKRGCLPRLVNNDNVYQDNVT